MPPGLVVCLRHGEKPANAEDPSTPVDAAGPGFDLAGRASPRSLTIKGWQRAYALAATDLCGRAPAEAGAITILVPDYRGNAERHRPYQTMYPLALRRGVDSEHPCRKDEIDELRDEVLDCEGIVVVCWEHNALEELVKKLVDVDVEWPKGRFDMLWLLRPDADGENRFQPVDQRLIPGDRGLPVPADG